MQSDCFRFALLGVGYMCQECLTMFPPGHDICRQIAEFEAELREQFKAALANAATNEDAEAEILRRVETRERKLVFAGASREFDAFW